MIFCRDGIKIGLENKFYGKCFPAYHVAGGHFLRNRLIPLAETGWWNAGKVYKNREVPSAQNSQSFFEEKVLL